MGVTLSDPTAGKPLFEAPAVGQEGATLTFQVTVMDIDGMQSSDSCVVTVNAPDIPARKARNRYQALSMRTTRMATMTINSVTRARNDPIVATITPINRATRARNDPIVATMSTNRATRARNDPIVTTMSPNRAPSVKDDPIVMMTKINYRY